MAAYMKEKGLSLDLEAWKKARVENVKRIKELRKKYPSDRAALAGGKEGLSKEGVQPNGFSRQPIPRNFETMEGSCL